jgi:hypothetical protein
LELIESLISHVRDRLDRSRIHAERALISAPFGAMHLSSCLDRWSRSDAVMRLSRAGEVQPVIITRHPEWARNAPAEILVLEAPDLPGWPDNDSHRSRFFKWGAPELFPELRASVWADADLIVTQRTEKLLAAFDLSERYGFVVTGHEIRSGWEDEFEGILAWRYRDRESVIAQRKFCRASGLPEDLPVRQTNVLLRRHDAAFRPLHREVLAQLLRFSERDQPALVFAAHSTGLSPHALPDGEILYTGFSGHVRPRSIAFVRPEGQSRLAEILAERGEKGVEDWSTPGGQRRPRTVRSRDLVIAAVESADSRHPEWTRGSAAFELMLVDRSEEPGRFREGAHLYFEARGSKGEAIRAAVEAHRAEVSAYDAVWLPDEDLDMGTLEINGLFRVFHQYGLGAAQPAFDGEAADVSPALLRRPDCLLRYVSRVGLSCPLLRTSVLLALLPELGSADLDVRGVRSAATAVIDAYPVRRTAPIHCVDPPIVEHDAIDISGRPRSLVRRFRLGAKSLTRDVLDWTRPLRQRLGITRRRLPW